MVITGLEGNYYCAHAPIPVEIQVDSTSYAFHPLEVKFAFTSSPSVFEYTARFYNIERDGNTNTFYVDLAPWVRQMMNDFEETYTYTTTASTYENLNVKSINVTFTAIGGETVIEESTVTKKYANCAIPTTLEDDNNCLDKCVKVWRYYPFSALFDGFDSRILSISTGESCPAIFGTCEGISYVNDVCKGVYIKWLNDRGYYSYWLFPPIEEEVSEGEEIDLIPRNPFSPYKSSNRDTLGMEVEELVTIRDKVPREYWSTIATLIGSPEVYMLRPDWELGIDDVATPNDWIKMTMDKPKFERVKRYNYAEVEIELIYPYTYTQKRI